MAVFDEPEGILVAQHGGGYLCADEHLVGTSATARDRSVYQRFGKRGFDLAVGLAMLVAFAPLLLLIGGWLRLRGKAPVLYRHERIGFNGRPFGCLKFTTMYPGSDAILAEILQSSPEKRREWETSQKLKDDPRVIPGVGHFLRNTSLDELPQLLNVIKGDMSIVGPRPVTAVELKYYEPHVQDYLSVKPGLTGPWQIGGRSDTTYEERVRTDVWYVRNVSLGTDAKVLAKTVYFFTSGQLKGAC